MGPFRPTELSQASGTEVRGHQIITIHRVLFWLSSFGKVDFVSDVSLFSDVAAFLFPSVPPVKHRLIMFPAGVGFPKGGAVPSFGKVASAAPKGQDRPTPQPHPQDLNPILQRPEHMPASTRTPVCNKCKNVIR